MMKRILFFLTLLLLAGTRVTPATAQTPVVRAVLFFLPTCGHCHQVINNELPWIFDTFGGQPDLYYDQTLAEEELTFYLLTNGQLEILLIDASHQDGAELYLAATERLSIPEDYGGVPRLIVGESYLVGSVDIPGQFPGLIEVGLAENGIDWPAIPGLELSLASIPLPAPALELSPTATLAEPPSSPQPPEVEVSPPLDPSPEIPEATEVPLADLIQTDDPTFIDRYLSDPVGNSFSVVVLIGMLAVLGFVALNWKTSQPAAPISPRIPLLAVLGLAVAGYLTFVEATDSVAVCGPVGDCNTLQGSRYATLFGVLPVGLLGLIAYGLILISWGMTRLSPPGFSRLGIFGIFTLSLAGALFSVYLTFLEPFVIGATCAWCLTSAVVITAIFWLSQEPAKSVWGQLRSRSG